MKDFLKKLIANKEARAKEIRESIKNSTDLNEVRSLGDTLEAILAELTDAKAQLADIEANEAKAAEVEADEARNANITKETRSFNPTAAMGFDVSGATEDNSEKEVEERAKKFADTGRMTINNSEARAVLISSGKIATPTEVADVKDGWNRVSSIVDQVNVEDLTGCGEYKVPYIVTELDAKKTAEGSLITEGDMTFGYATIKPHNVSVLTYISNQVLKQSPVKYEAKVRQSALTALRAKAADLIVNGDAEANFEGIIASNIAATKEITAIDEKTLRAVAFEYGGNENVEQGATLYLDKATLVEFGDVRGSDKKPVYKITPSSNGNTGIIEDGGLAVPYTINSKLNGKMVYGQALNYTLGLFGDYEVKVSEDYAFGKNLLTIRGSVDLGGAVCFDKGFIVVSKSGS